MHQMQWQGHTECPSPYLPIPPKQLMLGKKMRGRTKEEHEELQDLDPRGSPHLEEKVIGGNVDLDLLSLFPQELARIIGGIES